MLMIGTQEQDAFINRQKWAVATTLRTDGSPTNSVVFFARDGDELLFSTTAARLKAKTLRNDARIALCILDEGAPFGFVNVEGTAVVDDRDIVPGHVAVNRAMRGPGFTPPEGFEAGLRADGRVIVRLTAVRVSGVTNRG